ncbi:WD40-repeat-containing domain protein [Pelagophyceae sp. CCMP2097]|nr:WD40-repeat-containing domain protein [Pelagophyceae sp. CCMP2097]
MVEVQYSGDLVFTDEDVYSFALVSPLKSSDSKNKRLQTTAIFTDDRETAMADVAETGTDAMDAENGEAKADDAEAKSDGVDVKTSGIDLRVLEQRMLSELSQESSAFDDYVPLRTGGEEDVQYKYALTCKRAAELQLQCVSLSWNATGSMVVCGFGRRDTFGWCDAPGLVCCWSVFRSDFRADKPTHLLEHNSCVTAVSCHPKRPSHVAVGSFNGEVMVYDVSETAGDPLLACSAIDDYFHREPVTAVQWVADSAQAGEGFQLASLSGDGKILWWSMRSVVDEDGASLPHPVRGLRIATCATSQKGGSRPKDSIVGGTCMAVVVVGKTPSILVGSEGGMVLRLFGHGLQKDLLSKKKPKGGTLRWEPEAMELAAYVPAMQQAKLVKHVEAYVTQDHRDVVHARDVFKSKPKPTYVFPPPAGVVTEFEKHTGPTTALALSPFDRRLFLSAGVDGKLKLFSTLRTKPLAELERGGAADAGDAGGRFKAQGNGLYSADWSKVRPLVFVVAGDAGVVAIYDLADGGARDATPVAMLHIPSPKSDAPRASVHSDRILAVRFNPKQRDFLACGDAAGRVHVWQLPWRLGNPEPAEADALAKLATALEELN